MDWKTWGEFPRPGEFLPGVTGVTFAVGLLLSAAGLCKDVWAADPAPDPTARPGVAGKLINDPTGDNGRLLPLSVVFSQQDIMQRAKGVALLKVSTSQDLFYPCTGFLVGTRTLLTNHHCIQNQTVCEATEFVFGYWRDKNDQLAAQESFRCDRFLGGQSELDFALVTLTGLEKGQQKWPWLPLSLSPLDSQKPLYILQHPRGTPMQIAGPVISGGSGALLGYSCGILEPMIDRVHGYQDNSNFSYDCATESGSSGSPVLNAKGCVVGLHHGAEMTAAQGSRIAGLNLGVIMKILRPLLTNRTLQSACR